MGDAAWIHPLTVTVPSKDIMGSESACNSAYRNGDLLNIPSCLQGLAARSGRDGVSGIKHIYRVRVNWLMDLSPRNTELTQYAAEQTQLPEPK